MDNNFQKWLLIKFNRWQESEGEKKPEKDFAAFLGVGDKALNRWMNGLNNPNYKSALKIAQALDDYEILEILGYELPQPRITDDQLAPLAALIMQFPEEMRPRIRQIMVDVLEKMLDSDQPPSEEEALKLIAERILSELNKE